MTGKAGVPGGAGTTSPRVERMPEATGQVRLKGAGSKGTAESFALSWDGAP